MPQLRAAPQQPALQTTFYSDSSKKSVVLQKDFRESFGRQWNHQIDELFTAKTAAIMVFGFCAIAIIGVATGGAAMPWVLYGGAVLVGVPAVIIGGEAIYDYTQENYEQSGEKSAEAVFGLMMAGLSLYGAGGKSNFQIGMFPTNPTAPALAEAVVWMPSLGRTAVAAATLPPGILLMVGKDSSPPQEKVNPKDFDDPILLAKSRPSLNENPVPDLLAAKEAFFMGDFGTSRYHLFLALTKTHSRVVIDDVINLLQRLPHSIRSEGRVLWYERGKNFLEAVISAHRSALEEGAGTAQISRRIDALTRFQKKFIQLGDAPSREAIQDAAREFSYLIFDLGIDEYQLNLFFKPFFEVFVGGGGRFGSQLAKIEGLLLTLSGGRRLSQARKSFDSVRELLDNGNLEGARKALFAVKRNAAADGADNLVSEVDALIDATF